MVFWSFWVLDPILAHQTENSILVDNLASLDTPGASERVKVVEWNQNQLIRSLWSKAWGSFFQILCASQKIQTLI